MILWVVKNLLSLLVLGVFGTLVFVKVASHDKEDVMDDVGGFGGGVGMGFEDDQDDSVEDDSVEDDDTDYVYPPHMWKGLGFWMIIIYGIVNLIMLASYF